MATYRKIKDLSALNPGDKKKQTAKKWIWTLVALVLFAATVFGAYWITHPDLFKKKMKFTVEIHHSDYSVDTLEITTKEEMLIDALLEHDLILVSEDKEGKFILGAGDPHSGLEELYFDTVSWVTYAGDNEEPIDPFRAKVVSGTTYKIIFTTE